MQARGLPTDDRKVFLAYEHDTFVHDARRAGLSEARAQDFADKVAQWTWDVLREGDDSISKPAGNRAERVISTEAA